MKEKKVHIAFTINGRRMELSIPPAMLLLDLIREELSLKGTKPGCLEGECGACTVLIDDQPVNSCLYLAVNIHNREVTTIEGLSPAAAGREMDPVQQALIAHGGVQCGFCTPGMVMAIKAFQRHCAAHHLHPNREEIKKALAGNLCRCTGYTSIVNAVESLIANP